MNFIILRIVTATGGVTTQSLGSLDPQLYKASDDDDYDVTDDHIGRIWFAVEYENQSEKLLLTLVKVKNLPTIAAGVSGSCDHFVRSVDVIPWKPLFF